MARLTPLTPEAMTARQQRVFDQIASGPRGGVRGPLAVWLRSPGLADAAQRFGAFCRYETTLRDDLRELAILIVGAHWRAGFEFAGHAPIALEAGLAPEAIEAIRLGRKPQLSDDDERAVYEFVVSLVDSRDVPDHIWSRALACLGEEQVVELVGVTGYYTLISMTIKACDVDLQPGTADPFG